MTLRGTLRHKTAACLGVAALAAGPVYAADTAAGADTGTDREPVARHLPGWELKDTGSKARLRGLSAVSRDTAWASGSGGTVLRTADGGRSWQDVSPPGTEALEFRDIEALGRRSAIALSIGPGEDSRIYRTDDAGATWTETFRNDHPGAFYDCVTFFAGGRDGLALSDPVDGRFRILSTSDGGRSWKVLPDDGMPPAQPGDAAFAASGQCLVSAGRSDAWFATGGGATARVLHSADRGRTWTEAESGIPAGDPARGVFALAFRDARHGLAVGGDFQPGNPSPDAAARTGDGGASWTDARKPPPEYRSGVTWLPHSRSAALAVGPTGSDVTFDAGRTWHGFDSGSYDTVDCSEDLGCWAAGEQGRVARLE